VRALVCYLCVHQHLPLDRAAQLLADVLGAPMAHFDETGARVAGRPHWVHSASTAGLSLLTVHPKRGKVAMDAAGVLPGFGGVAVHHGWAPYWPYQHLPHARPGCGSATSGW
jgi:transposase